MGERLVLRAACVLSLAVLLGLGALGGPNAAWAQGPCAAVVIDNPTDFTITYAVKYGANGAWTTAAQSPGQSMIWSVAAAGDSYYVRFSTDIGNGGRPKEYRLPAGGRYAFGITPCGCYLDLYRR
jgi:hypothetical protein